MKIGEICSENGALDALRVSPGRNPLMMAREAKLLKKPSIHRWRLRLKAPWLKVSEAYFGDFLREYLGGSNDLSG